MSYAKLAQELRVSVSTVHRRIKSLLKEDIVKITAIPNPAKVGYPAIAFISMDVELGKIDEVCAKLVSYPNVNFVAVTFGRFDVIIHAHFASTELLSKFIKNVLSTVDGIVNIESLIMAEMKKRGYSYVLADETTEGEL